MRCSCYEDQLRDLIDVGGHFLYLEFCIAVKAREQFYAFGKGLNSLVDVHLYPF